MVTFIGVPSCQRKLIESGKDADILITQLFHDPDVARENSPLPENPPEEVYDLANEFLLECRQV